MSCGGQKITFVTHIRLLCWKRKKKQRSEHAYFDISAPGIVREVVVLISTSIDSGVGREENFLPPYRTETV